MRKFPASRFVFVARDPRDGYRSAKKNPRYWHSLPSSDPLQAFVETWIWSINAYRSLRDQSAVHLLSYENFCREPEQQLQAVNEFLGLDTQDRQLEPASYGQTRLGELKGQTRLREPITAETVGRWKDELDVKEVRSIEAQASEEMKRLGYSLSHSE